MNFIEWLSENKRGTYVGLLFNDESVKFLESFIKKHKIPNPVPSNKLHVTLLYSRKYLPTFKARESIENIEVQPFKFNVWNTNGENSSTSRCLVLNFKSH